MRKGPLTIMFVSLCIFLLSGCALMSKKQKQEAGPGMLEPQAMLKFADIPVPVGFKLLPQNSYSFENSGLRVGVLRYQGKANPDHIVAFYKEQMPMYNWTLLNIVEFGDRLMNFDRENETCIINIGVKGSTVTITASLGPKPQAARKPKQPIK